MIICGEEIIQKTTNRTTEHEPCWFRRLESSAAESVEVLFPNPSMRMEVSIFTSASHFLKTPCRNDLNVASSSVEMDWIFWFSELWWGASHSLVLPPKNREYRTNMNKPCTLMRTMMTNHGIDFGDTVTTSSWYLCRVEAQLSLAAKNADGALQISTYDSGAQSTQPEKTCTFDPPKTADFSTSPDIKKNRSV